MLDLSRTVRFCLNDADPAAADPPRHNAHNAWPPPMGLARYHEITVTCRGEADPATGYFINIRHIDTAVRDHALPVLRAALAGPGRTADIPMGRLMQQLLSAVDPALDRTVTTLTLTLTPRTSLTIRNQAMPQILLRQQFEFSAAHRLHDPHRSDQENRDIFGKCNNPAGHGHNYRLEVVVAAPIDPDGHALPVAALDRIVDQHAIEALDHKHLNHDVPAFADLNPSVEHIARIIWHMLVEPVTRLAPGAALEEISVWETGKTVCTYRGQHHHRAGPLAAADKIAP